MRTKKVKVLLIAIIIILQTVLPTLSYAVDTMKLNIQETRPFSDDDGDGETNDDVYKLKKNVNEQEVTESIFKIYDVDDKDIDESLLYSKALYCLRGGLGFGNVQYIEQLQNNEVTYTNFGDMKTNATSLISSYNTNTNSNIDASYIIGEYTFTPYNAILWIVDNMYVHSTDAEQNTIQKQFLNEKINKYNEAYTILNLTEDDIEVVQQLALWYFSNYNDGIYSLPDTVYLGNAITINEKDMVDVSKSRYKEITYLFEYLKNTAIQNAYKYGSENIRKINTDELTISFDETVKSKINEGTEDYYFVGPFKIDQVGGNTGYTNFELKFTITAIDSEGKSSVVNPTYYYISNAEGTRLQTTLKDMINWREDDGEFYLAIKKEYQAISGATLGYEVAELEFNVEYSYQYNESEASLWMTNSNDDQPVLLVERELLSKNDSSKVSIKDITGNFALKLEKYDEDENLLKGANFTLETLDRENIPLTNNNDGTFKTGTIGIKEDGQSFIYELTETVVPDGYIGLNDSVKIKIETGLNKGETEYIVTDAYFIDESGQKITNEKLKISVNDTASLITIKIKNILIKSFDLALRKYITKVNDEAITTRKPNIDVSKLNVTELTAEYKHRKDPVEVSTGDKVTYEITIYNEGEISGRATKVVDQLPTGLKFVKVVSGNYEVETYNTETNKLALKETASNTNLSAYTNELSSTTIEIECEVTATVGKNDKVLTNIAWISEEYNTETGVTITTQKGEDRDSEPGTAPSKTANELVTNDIGYTGTTTYTEAELADATKHFEGMQDDDDFEKLVIKGKSFDLALRKYITKVNDETYSREPVVDTSTIATTGTATYKHSKKPISVKKGDIVTYTIRVYNEGGLDGYVEEITDYLPDNLLPIIEDLNSIDSKKYKDEIEFNNKWLWTYSEKENTVKTTITSKSNSEKYAILTGLENVADTKLDAYVEGSNKLDYIDVQIKCLVKESNQILTGTYLTNIAEISKMCDENGVEQETDRDSTKENVDHTNLTDYKNKEALNSTEDSYIPGQEDDDDFEKLIIEVYDLSLRKFITNINRNGTAISIGNSREPNVDTTTLLNLTSTTATYNHKKDPIEVQVGDIVTYTIRVYNEGTIDGIPAEITEYIPTYLDFDPNDELNKKYGWELVDNYTNNGVGVLKTTYFKDTVLKAFSYQKGDSLDNTSNYTVGDLKINFIVNSTAEIGTIMTNTSEISIYQNAKKERAIDRDSGEQWEIGIMDYGINLMNNALYKNYVQTGEITQEKADEISKYVETAMIDYKPDYTSSDYGVSAYLDSKGITATNFVANAPEGVPEEILQEAYKIINSGNSNQELTKAYADYINQFFQSYKGIVSNKNDLTDSQYYYVGQEDDDDFEKLIIKTEKFDLALRKYIKAINNEDLSGQDSRVPKIDTTSLKDESSTTATYTHSKTPLTVKKGDIITYTIRIYNEGKLDGFASEITDYIPEGLGYILNYKQNTDNAWIVEDSKETTVIPLIGENGLYQNSESVNNLSVENFYETESLEDVNIVKGKAKIKTSALDDEEIKGYGKAKEDKDKWQASVNDAEDGLFYQEIDIVCIVLAENNCQDVLRNIAEITEDVALDEKGNEVQIVDRDSTPDNVDLDNYKYKEENSTYQEDDDDYEPIQLKYFDLALRKFITAVEDKEITSRIPKFYIDEDGNYKYEHSKEPVEVANGDEVTYTIRIFNEGTIAGYAEEIEDDIPEGLIFLPENETNKKYAWKMYREIAQDEEIGADKSIVTKNGKTYVETEDVSEAVIIRTEYLSEANGSISEDGINSNLIKAYNSETMKDGPDYRDVKVVFKVSEKDISEDNTDRIITNRAHITEDSDDDFDSTPNEWNEGEDDQDVEHVYVKEFDLALFKWVTKTIVKVDGKTTTRETGFKPNTGLTEQEGEEYRNNKESEPIASVTIDKKKLDKTEVKFVYKIKVVNEGEIAGYATEIRDYIPTGLKFIAEDNPLWKDEGNNVISTRALETKLLEPGQSEELEIVFTWINGADNLGLKTNIAAIVEDYNEKGAEDVDSDPGNENIPEYNKEQEDDDDYALVILVLKTGAEKTYIELVLLVVAILTVGIILIKKYAIK